MHLPQASSLAVVAGILTTTVASPAPWHIDVSVETNDASKGADLGLADMNCKPWTLQESPGINCQRLFGIDWRAYNRGTKAEPKWTCCQLIRAVDTTVATKIDRHTLHNPLVMESLGSSEPDWCYAYTFPIDCPFGRRQEPQCPEDLHSKNVGTEENPCWTCCGTPDESNAVTNLGKSSLADPKRTSLSHDETCAAVQFPRYCPFGRQSQTPACPDGWNAKNAGEDGNYCWTCCYGVNEEKITRDDPDDEPEDQCLPWAFPFHCPLGTQDEEPECLDGWYAEDMGFGDYPSWTCCPEEEEPVTPEKALESTVKETCVTVDFPMRCPFGHQSREPQCPKKWYPKNVGVSRNYCWTCCQESEDETSLELL